MSETPRPERNSSGNNRPARNGGRKDFGKGKGGFAGRDSRGGFKRSDRDDKRGGFKRSDRNESRDDKRGSKPGGKHQGKGFKKGDSRGPKRGTGPAEAPREEAVVRSIGGRAGYRPSKSRAPEIDSDVTGRELDGATFRELRALEPRNAETVAKHLVMAGRYLDIDPEFALAHAVAASRSAGRIAAVREAVGIAAYVAEDYEVALRELRTHRRISGSVDHLALLVDCERALGRLPKAQEMIQEAKGEKLPAAVRVELAIVESGMLLDSGDAAGAVKALEIEQLNPKRAFDYSPRLYTAYSQALEAAGRAKEADRWARLSVIAEAALGQGDYSEPSIFDIFDEEAELLEPKEVVIQESAETDSAQAEADTVVEDQAAAEEAEQGLTEADTVETAATSEEQADLNRAEDTVGEAEKSDAEIEREKHIQEEIDLFEN
ncbi:MAG: hypothetical protein Q4P78_03130 [Rothia sp. (in: high G+C Gram-positive bacteria)]|uniref:tetratricopeptide repeat protein n=1 Tax=Rothia sp. (in: high G+C Gram-positive bacteria) TaxID=1885016 RepID=UPI0026E0B999|nr:hypothetical protein [Rothia sp. (in: high G+C Gram-positive bacteria)]MDO5750183.1 hypothetical protein [Rothia sp. (in: high G+C Gram-positive bacteria)]